VVRVSIEVGLLPLGQGERPSWPAPPRRSDRAIPPVALSIPWIEPGGFFSARAMSLMDSPAFHRSHNSLLRASGNPGRPSLAPRIYLRSEQHSTP
jgi:hypothetical protein